jgi:hypothetical protein
MVKAMVKRGMLVNQVWTISLLGLAIGLNACGQKTAKQAPTPETLAQAENATAPIAPTLPVPPNGQAFLQPTVPQIKPEQMSKLPIKGLKPATKPESRLAELTMSKNSRDPFSMLNPGIPIVPPIGGFKPVIIPKAKPVTKPAKVAKAKAKPAAKIKPLKLAKPPMNFAPSAVLPAPLPIQTTPVAAMPVLPVAAPVLPQASPIEVAEAPLPPISPTSLAEQVEISGVVQMGGKSMVIAKAGNENSARYLQTGDSLAGGQVYIKSIRVSPMGDPIVILEQNGVEITKTVGSAPRVAAIR